MERSVHTIVMVRIYSADILFVNRHAHRLGEALVLNRRLQHRALVEPRHHRALDLLQGLLG
jgi:hypothetical protein